MFPYRLRSRELVSFKQKRSAILTTLREKGPMGPLSLVQDSITRLGVTINPRHSHPTWWYKALYQLRDDGLVTSTHVRARGHAEHSRWDLTAKGRQEASLLPHV